MAWPTTIEGNIFSVCALDPEAPQELKVESCTTLGVTGRKAIIAVTEVSGRYSRNFASIDCGTEPSLAAREYLQGILNDFSEDLAENWRALVLNARKKVLAYYRERAEGALEQLSKYEAGDWSEWGVTH